MPRSFFTRLIEFAAEKFRAEYATGRNAVRLPCSGYDETTQAIALGGASLAHELSGDRTGPRNLNDESQFHANSNITGEQRCGENS